MIEYAYTCHRGLTREENEDNFWCRGRILEEGQTDLQEIRAGRVHPMHVPCFALFDGMGGPQGKGAEASRLAARTFGECYKMLDRKRAQVPMKRFMESACGVLNQFIYEEGLKKEGGNRTEAGTEITRENELENEPENDTENPSAGGTVPFGCTGAMIGFWQDYACVCNVGDSRVYLNADRKTVQLSVDHRMKEADGAGKKRLTQFFGMDKDPHILTPDIVRGKCHREDVYLLCSNGLTDAVSDREIGRILTQHEDPALCVRELLRAALVKKKAENVTIIVCRVD